MERITVKHLQGMINRLNRLTNSPAEPYGKDEHGKFKANIGCFHLSHAYGGVQLDRICNEAGGVSTPLGLGHGPKRDLYDRIYAYIRGIEDAQELKAAA